MPKNKATGKANRQALMADEIFKFREDKYLKMFNLKRAKKKGNQALQLREEERQQEASGSGDSPSTTLAPLGALFLDSPSPEEPSSESPSQDQSPPSALLLHPPLLTRSLSSITGSLLPPIIPRQPSQPGFLHLRVAWKRSGGMLSEG